MGSLIPRKQRHEIMDVFGGLEDMFRGLRAGSIFDELPGFEGRHWAPRLDVSETDKVIEVKADLPGLAKKDIDISLDHDLLVIKGEKREEHEEKGKHSHRIERRSGSFYRALRLPVAVEGDHIEATFTDGVLTVTLPKAEEDKGVTHISVH
ncbi:MAG: Hsp20/alpha crystallin family protein [Thermodesulfobacteriota bacterium]